MANTNRYLFSLSMVIDFFFRLQRGLLSLAWPRESNQREGHPMTRPAGPLGSGILLRSNAYIPVGVRDSKNLVGMSGVLPHMPEMAPAISPAFFSVARRVIRVRMLRECFC